MIMELKEADLNVGERRVGRLMRFNGIKPVRTRKHKVTTDSHHRLSVVANWLDGDFVADAPNRKWAGDITYVWTLEGRPHLAVILDLHSRRVVGWAVSDRMKEDLAIRALDMAVRLRNPSPGCLFYHRSIDTNVPCFTPFRRAAVLTIRIPVRLGGPR